MSHPSYFPPPPMSPWRYPISTLGPLDDGVAIEASSSPLFNSAPASLSPFTTAHHYYSSQPPFATPFTMQGNVNATMASQAVPPFDNLINSMSALQIRDDSLALVEAPPRHFSSTESKASYHLDIPTRTRRWGARYVDFGTQTDEQPLQTPEAQEPSPQLKLCDSAHDVLPSPSPSPPTADLICLDTDELERQGCPAATVRAPPSTSASEPVSRTVDSDSSQFMTGVIGKSEDFIKPAVDAYVVDLNRNFKFEEVEVAAQSGQTPEWLRQENFVIASVPASYLRNTSKSGASVKGDHAPTLQTSAEKVRQPATIVQAPQQTPINPGSNILASNNNEHHVRTSSSSTAYAGHIKDEETDTGPQQNPRSNVLSAQAIEEAFASNAARTRALVRPRILELGSASSAASPRSLTSPASDTVALFDNKCSAPHTPLPLLKETDNLLHSVDFSVDVSMTVLPLVDIDVPSIAQSATSERKEVAKILVDVPKASYNGREEEKRPASPVIEPAKMAQRVPVESWPLLLARPLSRSEDQRLEAIEHLLSALTAPAPNESRYEFSCQMRTIVRLAAAFDVHPCDFGVKGEEEAPLTLGDVKISTAEDDGKSTGTMHLEIDCSRVKTATADKWVFQSQPGATSMGDIVTDLVQSLAWRRAIDVVGKADDDVAKLTKLAPLSGAATLNPRAPPTDATQPVAASSNPVLRRGEPLFVNESRSSPEIFNQSTRIKFGKRSLPRPFDFGRIITPATQESIWIALLSAANRASVILEAVFGPEPATLPVTVRMGDVAKRVHEMENKARPVLDPQSQGQHHHQQQQQPLKQIKTEPNNTKAVPKAQQASSKKKKGASCTCKVVSRNHHFQQKGCHTIGKLKNVPNGPRGAQVLPTKPQKGGKEANVIDQAKTKTSKQHHSSSDYETAPEEDKARKVRVKKESKKGLPVPVLLPKDIPLPCSDAEEKEQEKEQEKKGEVKKPMTTSRDLEMVDWRAALLA